MTDGKHPTPMWVHMLCQDAMSQPMPHKSISFLLNSWPAWSFKTHSPKVPWLWSGFLWFSQKHRIMLIGVCLAPPYFLDDFAKGWVQFHSRYPLWGSCVWMEYIRDYPHGEKLVSPPHWAPPNLSWHFQDSCMLEIRDLQRHICCEWEIKTSQFLGGTWLRFGDNTKLFRIPGVGTMGSVLRELALAIPSPSANPISGCFMFFKNSSRLSFKCLTALQKRSSFYFILLCLWEVHHCAAFHRLHLPVLPYFPRTVQTPHHPTQSNWAPCCSLSTRCRFLVHEDGDHVSPTHHCISSSPPRAWKGI